MTKLPSQGVSILSSSNHNASNYPTTCPTRTQSFEHCRRRKHQACQPSENLLGHHLPISYPDTSPLSLYLSRLLPHRYSSPFPQRRHSGWMDSRSISQHRQIPDARSLGSAAVPKIFARLADSSALLFCCMALFLEQPLPPAARDSVSRSTPPCCEILHRQKVTPRTFRT